MRPQNRPYPSPVRHGVLRRVVGIVATFIFAAALRVPLVGLAREDAGVRMSFDLPADYAERSLKRFSERSGLEVLFVSESAANVRTNAVKGDYTAREAIDRMLAGTKLAAVQKEKNGALTIVSISSVNGRNGSTAAAPDSQSSKKKAQKP